MPERKKIGSKRTSAADEPEARSSKGSGMSKAELFNKTKAQGQVDSGKYEAVISEFIMQDEDEKGQSARIKYRIASEGDFQGQEITQFYKMFEANGSIGKGAPFLKKDLAVLGYDDVEFESLDDVLKEIEDNHLGVVITVKINGAFTNAYLGGLCEDSDIIKEFLANNPF